MASSMALLARGSLVRPVSMCFRTRSILAATQLRFQSTNKVTFEDGKSKWVGLTNDQDFFEKNEKMHRPMSPHLTIYKFPLPAIMSVSHRGSGIALTGAICAAGIGLMVHPLAFYVDAAQAMNISPALITAAKFSFAFPFTFHTVNGMRHLFWDTAKGLSLDQVYSSSYVTLGLATVSALGLTML